MTFDEIISCLKKSETSGPAQFAALDFLTLPDKPQEQKEIITNALSTMAQPKEPIG